MSCAAPSWRTWRTADTPVLSAYVAIDSDAAGCPSCAMAEEEKEYVAVAWNVVWLMVALVGGSGGGSAEGFGARSARWLQMRVGGKYTARKKSKVGGTSNRCV
jgi:hypothetical protein